MRHLRNYEVLVDRTQKTRISDSLYWIPSPLSPPIPTEAEMIQIAVDNLREASNTLARIKGPISDWRRVAQAQGRDIDKYINIYHPYLTENADDEMDQYIERTLPLTRIGQQQVEQEEILPKRPDKGLVME